MDFLRKTPAPLGASPLDRLRQGGTAVTDRGLSRPGFLEKLTASRAERELMAQSEEAHTTVALAKIDAATQVALSDVTDIRNATLRERAILVAEHFKEMEMKMAQNNADAKRQHADFAIAVATDVMKAKHHVVAEFDRLAATDAIDPEDAKLLRAIAAELTDAQVRGVLELREKFEQSHAEHVDRALARNR